MTEKRFERIYADVDVFCRDNNAKEASQLIEREDYDRIVDLLNELHDEKEAWKQSCCSYSNFNSILLHELDIAREQGFEVSNPFKQFLEDRGDVE